MKLKKLLINRIVL